MCSSKVCPIDLEMEAEFQENNGRIIFRNCSKLLELAATDDLNGFICEVEERGCDIDEASFWYGRSFASKKMGFEKRTPLMIASLYGNTEVLKYILGTGKVDVNRSCGSDGATPLHCAAAGGSWSSVDIVKLLIDASANFNAIDANGKKPSDLIASCVKSASCNSKRKVLEMLLNGLPVKAAAAEEEVVGEEGGDKTPRAEKKEYPVDVSLPDINNSIYGSDEFRMFSFKVKPCSRAYSHDWTECPFVHPGENARRRDPRKYNYTCVPCPEFKKGSCAKSDNCEYAHGVFESWLHPAQYRTRLCKDETGCSRKVCFFAHKPEELRPLYPSTGSAMPSPKSMSMSMSSNSLDLGTLSPLSLGSSSMMLANNNINNSTPPMSPSVTCSSPMAVSGGSGGGGGGLWQSKMNMNMNLPLPTLQLPGSRLKTASSARDMELDMDMAMGSLSSQYSRMGDLKPTNLDDVFGSLDPSLVSQLQSPTRRNVNQLRASYPSTLSSSPARKPSAYGFDSSAAMAAAMMNARSSAFAKRSQSFVDRGGVNNHRSSIAGPTSSPTAMPSKLSDWGSPDGKLDWGFSGDEVNKLRKSASFGFRSNNNNNNISTMAQSSVHEPDVSWVNSLVKDVPLSSPGKNREKVAHWVDQFYLEQEQIVA